MKPKNVISLLLATFIWGMAFVAQRVGMDYVGPFTFNGTRCLLGGLVLLPFALLLGRRKRNAGSAEEIAPALGTAASSEASSTHGWNKTLFIGALVCGLLLFAASSLQQIGLQYVTAGKSGFITSFYIVFVPVLGIFLKRKAGWKVWIAVVIAIVGLYFLCISENFTIGRGDLVTFASAIMFAFQILGIDHFAPKVDVLKFSCVQLFICGAASLPFMFALETPTFSGLWDAILPLLYAGVLSCGVAYTLQIVGQRNANPTIASLLMSVESCFAVLGGWVILGERLSGREGLGCILIFGAVVLAELPKRSGRSSPGAPDAPSSPDTPDALSAGPMERG